MSKVIYRNTGCQNLSRSHHMEAANLKEEAYQKCCQTSMLHRGAQLNEALQMQKEVHRRLSDQLEVQGSLKMKIEAQGKFLERIAEEYKTRTTANAWIEDDFMQQICKLGSPNS